VYKVDNYSIETEFDDAVWDNFVNVQSRNGTLFHTRKFLSYHKDRFNDCSLTISKRNKIIAVIPAILNDDTLISHSGSSFGGIVVHKNAGLNDIFNIVDCISYFMRRKKLRKVIMRMSPHIYNIMPCDDIYFTLYKKGYNLYCTDLCCSIDLTINKKYSDSVNRNINKSRDSYTIDIGYDDDNFEMFWDILSNNLMEKHGVLPTHTLDEILLLKSLLPNKIILCTCYYKGKLISGVVLFLGNSNAFEVFYIAQDYEFQNIRSMSLLIDYIINFGKFNRYKFCNLGVSTEDSGNIVNHTLVRFKEGFGARGIARNTYIKEILI